MMRGILILQKNTVSQSREFGDEEDIAADSELKSAEVDLGWMVNSGLDGFDGLYGTERLNLLFVNYSKKKEWAREQ